MDTEDGIKISEFPSSGVIHNSDVVTGLHAGENYNFTFSRIMAWFKDAVTDLFVPTTREINGQDLSSDIDLTAEDVGAAKPDIIASIETDTGHQAQKNYSVGEMMIVPGGILCVAIAPISIGDSLISDTNIKEVTVSDRIMEVEGEIPSSPEDIGAVGTNIIARVETSQTSEHYYLEGQYLILSGLLYRTSTIINIGDTIAAGSNVVLATVGGELESIKAIIPTQASDIGAVDSSDVGVADGVASLDSNGVLDSSQAPPASDIDYDNTTSGLTATKVQAAIDEVYDAIPDDASDVDYDNTTSGLTATNVQTAIDEVVGDVGDKQDTITASGILKGDGAGGVSAAVSGTDYQAPLTAGTDYATPAQLADKANQAQLATVETGSTASKNYAVGEYFCLNGFLYRVTSAISSGGTFTPGTNCESVTASTAFLTTYPIRIYNTNLDSLDYGGIYQLATGNTNGPTDIGSINWSTMFMFGDGGWNGMQMIFANSHIRYRTRFNTIWSSWTGSF